MPIPADHSMFSPFNPLWRSEESTAQLCVEFLARQLEKVQAENQELKARLQFLSGKDEPDAHPR